MPTLYTLKEANIRKTWLYLAGFFVLALFLAWFLSYYFDNQSIFLFAFVLSSGASFSSFWFSDKIVLAMSRAKPIEKKDNPGLYRLVENLCIAAGLPLPKIYLIDDSAPNAFATGRNPSHAVIAVTSGLLAKLEKTELEGVLAHELGHIGNRDTLLATIVVVLVGLIIRMADLFFRTRLGSRRRDKNRSGDIFLLLGLVFMVLAPIAAQLMRLAISRKREFLADASSALLTRFPEGLAGALEKISSDSMPLKTASNATAHLYIVNPLKGERANNWLTKLFMTHPPVEQRIAALRGMEV